MYLLYLYKKTHRSVTRLVVMLNICYNYGIIFRKLYKIMYTKQ